MSTSVTQTDRLADGRIVLDSPVALPPVLDLLIVGGGPMGTACAFRAKELGLAALVIDMDDLLKRIRDYAKDKPILPDYGGGDTMDFPAGGALVSALRFAPIDKDEMVELWRSLYRRFSVPAQIGVEMLTLERQQDGLWRADCRNHCRKQNQTLLSRTVVLGLGRGVPRRLDISGNVQDLALRLIDADSYIGSPACVIGGGTSAAEAVIAISNAKAQSGTDDSPVYWSYRGHSMPKVSQALAPDLFDAMVMNGNLRFALGSEPVGIAARDGTEYLAIRTNVAQKANEPRQVVQLEFAKASCVACIGADRPDPLLRSLGVDFVPKPTGDGDRLVVSPLLETRRPGLHVGGDLLSPDYAETMDFEAHPSTFVARSRKGNIKAALRDGVLLAEVVKQRLEGKQDIRVVVAPSPPPAVSPSAAAAAAATAAPGPGRLISLLADGTPADEFPLPPAGAATIGRMGTTIAFPNDSMLSDQHASIVRGADGLELHDLGSANGVFVKVAEGRAVPFLPGTIVRAGRQWLISQAGSGGPEVVHCDAAGRDLDAYPLADGDTIVFGRSAPATVLASSDTTLSRRHLSVSREHARLTLRDLGSRNGTFIKVEGRWPLRDDDVIWMGNQQLRVDLAEPLRRDAVVSGRLAIATQPAAFAPGPAVASGPVVTFGTSHPVPFGASPTLLDLALTRRVRIKYDCKVGDCLKCRVVVTEGLQHLNPKTPQEEKGLKMIGHAEPESRLACLVTRVTGPVAIEVPK
jgi:ferredoxin/pSer/pThr/pTyr-binding forkhead associated (FHA) protein/thioredoxin reductase